MDWTLYALRSILLSFSPLFPSNLHVPFYKSTSSMVYGPVLWSSILCPFLYFGAYYGVEKHHHSEMCNQSLLFFSRTASFAFLVQHLCCPALLAVNFCTCSWRTFSEVNFIVFHNAGFSLALLSTLDALKPFCNCLI